VQCDVKLPSPAGADDGEPPEADSLGSHWLSRATPSERSLSEGDLDLDLDLDNPADVRDDGAQDDEVAYGHDQERKPGLVAAAGWRRG